MDPPSRKLYPGLVQSFGIIITFLILSICVDLLMTVLTGDNHTAPVPYTAGIALATALTLGFAWFLSEAPVEEAFPRRSIFLCIVTHVMWNGFFFVQGTISGGEPASIPLAVNVAALCLVAGGLRQLRKYV